ncbi:hypothetical protein B0H67DRAFT_571907 [Lasiosphaeris hirsuta]|uniref:Uncharacterized protein n=1 Tax=Lasiosphaeris hirsuta TaxID=260670 RepID=A0AA40B1J3_9PEZI|nr:hypothetical protein B0H67DRAFT_571907 [Lasiosphaeris hirsuta]
MSIFIFRNATAWYRCNSRNDVDQILYSYWRQGVQHGTFYSRHHPPNSPTPAQSGAMCVQRHPLAVINAQPHEHSTTPTPRIYPPLFTMSSEAEEIFHKSQEQALKLFSDGRNYDGMDTWEKACDLIHSHVGRKRWIELQTEFADSLPDYDLPEVGDRVRKLLQKKLLDTHLDTDDEDLDHKPTLPPNAELPSSWAPSNARPCGSVNQNTADSDNDPSAPNRSSPWETQFRRLNQRDRAHTFFGGHVSTIATPLTNGPAPGSSFRRTHTFAGQASAAMHENPQLNSRSPTSSNAAARPSTVTPTPKPTATASAPTVVAADITMNGSSHDTAADSPHGLHGLLGLHEKYDHTHKSWLGGKIERWTHSIISSSDAHLSHGPGDGKSS